jgi:protein tyrosine/serine phosphatase
MQPPVVDEFLALLDDEKNYPVLIHCKAGLHRTGRLTAIYRMEYEGWSHGEALRELRANGYGYLMASEGDEYIIQFVQNYTPRALRKPPVAPMPRPRLPEGGGK